MKTKRYEHGTAFEETFTVMLRGEVEGQPVGWGCANHEKKWLEDSLRDAVKEAMARYYQCQLYGVSLDITIPAMKSPKEQVHNRRNSKPKIKTTFETTKL
jgi:hypothetical protein